jgi:hypothetical protein
VVNVRDDRDIADIRWSDGSACHSGSCRSR